PDRRHHTGRDRRRGHTGAAEEPGRVGRGDRGRGLRDPRGDRRAPTHTRGRHVRLGRGARAGAGPQRPDARGRPADGGDPRTPERLERRPRLPPRADARRRVRRTGQRRVRTLRLLAIGWKFHFKMIMRSAFDGVGQVIYPLFFATVAFFVFRAGDSPRTLLY